MTDVWEDPEVDDWLDDQPLPVRVGEVSEEVLEAARRAGRRHAAAMLEARRHRSDGRRAHARNRRRPRIYPQLVEDACQLLREGVPTPELALNALGVNKSTAYSWTMKGRNARETLEATGKVPEGDRIYLDLVERLDVARAETVARLAGHVERIATGGEVSSIDERFDEEGNVIGRRVFFRAPHPKTLTWYLERTSIEEFGRTRLEVTGADGKPIEADVAVSAKELLAQRLGLAAERLGVTRPEPED